MNIDMELDPRNVILPEVNFYVHCDWILFIWISKIYKTKIEIQINMLKLI